MKTSELKKIVEENEYNFQKTEDFIYISYFGHKRMTLDLREQSITLDMFLRLGTPKTKKIMVALIEYSLTPLNEREDEKKYNLKYNDTCFNFMDSWLVQGSDGKFWFSVFMEGKFTQQEIDNFPAEIKGAIECGFLRKVEVE